MPGVFVTGTDTEVGKTVVSCAILAGLRARGHAVSALKPLLTGLDEPGPYDHELLAAITGQPPDEVAPERFGPAVSPHLAMAAAGRTVDVAALLERARALPGHSVVEGAGGLLAPFDGTRSMRDVAAALGRPVVLVARPGLGTINHTLLTLEAARAAGLRVRAVVLGPWPAEPDTMLRSNRETIAQRGAVDVVTIPHVDASDHDALAAAAADWPLEAWCGEAGVLEPGTAGLDHVVIAVSDWERSNAFYERVCGARLVRLDEPPPTRWRYRFGAHNLNVHGPGMDPLPVAKIPAAPGMADLCLTFPGTAAQAVAHLEGCGVEVEDGPVWRNGSRGPGLSVYFRDPDGSLLEFIAYG